jgi:hypothetical protein
MSLLDLNMVSILVDDLNTQIKYQVSGHIGIPMEQVQRFLTLQSDGGDHVIYFLGSKLWSTADEREFENVPVEAEIELNTRVNFERFLRNLIQEEVSAISSINLLQD